MSKSYGGRQVLRDVSFQVREGEFAALTGPSGSGKTTLFRLLIGELKADSGGVIVNGRNLSRLDASGIAELRRELGLVFEEPRLIERLTVIDNIALSAEVAGRTRNEASRMAEEALERVGLDDAARCFPRDLCAGERQRVSLARALVNRPPIILADEPTLGLDPDQSLYVLKILTQACREDGTSVLMATHDMEALSVLRGRVFVMSRGRLLDEEGLEAACA
ncbi:MAG TPA: ABC transporter ATP-binding protein [Candidatus Limnocylindrales bacterium]|nr:ABC transporter ATP-binding protein [Candidatus Limnocylindrales bacterium]